MPKKMHQKHRLSPNLQTESGDREWLDMTPIGREIGSPDYERLTALDQAAFAVFQSWDKVELWLTAPNPQLDGACPEDMARNSDGLSKVMSILMFAGGHASEDFMRDIDTLPVQDRNALKERK